MQTDPQSVIKAALQLPEADRFALISRLMDSLPPDDGTLSVDDLDFMAELDRRSADDEPGIPWSQLKSES